MRYVTLCTTLYALMSGIMLAQQPKDKKVAKIKAQRSTHQDAGERAFQENCSRCHYAPQSLSPRITGTVVRHMRVRANLTAHDAQLILEFLNP